MTSDLAVPELLDGLEHAFRVHEEARGNQPPLQITVTSSREKLSELGVQQLRLAAQLLEYNF